MRSASGLATWPVSRSVPTISVRSSGSIWRSRCARSPGDLERLCRYLEPCGQGNPGPVFGVRGVRFTSRSVVGNGHLKGALDDGTTRLWTIGFQWADRVPWLGDELVDVAFRIECDEWNGMQQSPGAALRAHAAHRRHVERSWRLSMYPVRTFPTLNPRRMRIVRGSIRRTAIDRARRTPASGLRPTGCVKRG